MMPRTRQQGQCDNRRSALLPYTFTLRPATVHPVVHRPKKIAEPTSHRWPEGHRCTVTSQPLGGPDILADDV
jgi:hypothetical protein